MDFLLNVSDVLNYAREGRRKYIIGENIVNSNNLMYRSITYECDGETTLTSLCVKSSDLFGSSYEIEVIITNNTDKYKKINYKF